MTVVGAAAGWHGVDRPIRVLDPGVAGRQIAASMVAVLVDDADDDQRRHEIGVHEEVDRAANFVDIGACVRQIEHRVASGLPLRCGRHPHDNHAIFIENAGTNH